MVKALRKHGSLRSPAVQDAFLAIPREAFVPEIAEGRGLQAIYNPIEALPTKTDALGIPISSSSAPSIMAPMLEDLDLQPGGRVLEIGAGTGYNAALIKTLVGHRGRVTTVDLDADTSARARKALQQQGISATVRQADGMKGWPRGGPYDRIIVTASSAEIPRAWLDQLVPGGRLQLPLRLRTSTFGPQVVVTLEKKDNSLVSRSTLQGGFMGLRAGPDSPGFGRVSIQARAGEQVLGLSLSGDSIGGLSDQARRALIGVMATRPRTTTLATGTPERVGGLALYAALGLPEGMCVETDGWWTSGVLDPSGSGLALLEPRGLLFNPHRRASVRLSSRGSGGPERKIRELASAWREAGSPEWSDLRVTASYNGGRSGWRSSKRGEAVLSFGWSRNAG